MVKTPCSKDGVACGFDAGDQAVDPRTRLRVANRGRWLAADQVRNLRRFARRALAFAGREPWLAFLIKRWGLAMTELVDADCEWKCRLDEDAGRREIVRDAVARSG
jgi:hypothetical protein